MAIYTGVVQGVSKISEGTPSAFCRKVSGGSLSIDAHNIINKGIGGKIQVRKGTAEISLDIDCVGISAADIQLFFPTTASAQVASFPDFLVECDDGTNGQEWVLSGGQPSSISISCSEGEDSQIEYSISMKFTTATLQAIGTDIPVYNSVIGHTINDITFEIDNEKYGTLSFEVSNDLGLEMVNYMDGKDTGEKSFPGDYVITSQDTSCSLSTVEILNASAIFEDAHTEVDITISLENGTTAEDITIELDGFVPSTFNMPLEAEGVVQFAHEYMPGDGASGINYGRVTIS